ncbi:hypothetical protein AB0L41_04115 [Amycolatopsis mediterranei]|uniref:hypothetical protein n=1 Tax=Amycolatopsis mediterranei TaxID=33910 RepID=UPI003444D727
MTVSHEVPDLTGRTIVVTGTTSGLGLALSGALAAAGARVLMTVRDAARGANVLFSAELDRRLRLAGDPVLSIAAHPGLTASDLLNNALARGTTWKARLLVLPDRWVAQPVAAGIRPQLLAATGPVRGGAYLGPTGPFEIRGPAGPARRSAAAQDPVLARELWQVTATATGVTPDPGLRSAASHR